MAKTARKVQKRGTQGKQSVITLDDDPLWFKEAILYEVHVRAFHDSNGDGIGDFQGLREKLPYLRDLGVTALWLLPFYPSPLKDDGYDIADYKTVNPIYGDLKDFKEFLHDAHALGLRVITELVVNHTSDQHPWFQRARKAPPGHPDRDFYVWSDTAERYADARIIFKDFEVSNWTYDREAKAYYWHRFYSHQPDLNFENPRVGKAVEQVLDYWFEMGVDGLRLDAVPYLFEREGTNCENLPETHDYLKSLRKHLDTKHKNKMLLAEANQWPEDAVAYFGDGDECHMNFHFPLMPRMFMSVRMEDRFPIIDILDQTPEIPDNCQWATFLRNHDELTLEMVTDEERDYMYRVYAEETRARINLGIRRRLAPLLGNDRRKIELMNALLLSLPGTPVLYYGDEIGMGDNIYLGDRDAVRTPFQWSGDRNAGFSRANPQKLFLPVIIDPEYHFETVNMEAQQNNPNSLLWWMKRIIALRKQSGALSRGRIEFLHPENRKMLVFVREYEGETILAVANLSRQVQYVELELGRRFEGYRPVEMFGHTEFPRIGELPYFLTLGPYSFYWFQLEKSESLEADESERPRRPVLDDAPSLEALISGKERGRLENQALPRYLRTARWFGGKARKIKNIEIKQTIPLKNHGDSAVEVCLVEVHYSEGESELYQIHLGRLYGEEAERFREESPHAALAELRPQGKGEKIGKSDKQSRGAAGKGEASERAGGLLIDALAHPETGRALLLWILHKKRVDARGAGKAEVQASAEKTLRQAIADLPRDEAWEPQVLRGEQSNTSVVFNDRLILKIFRRIERGVNPDLEIGRFLLNRTKFKNMAPLAGALELAEGGEAATLGVLHGYVSNLGDAWRYTVDLVGHYQENIRAAASGDFGEVEVPEGALIDLLETEPTEVVRESIGSYLFSAETLGQRTAEMHLALASRPDDAGFSHESFSAHYLRGLYQSMRNLSAEALGALRKSLRSLEPGPREAAEAVLACETEIQERFRRIVGKKIEASRIRIHGDYHLGQVLYTGRDFVILDFEGEPLRSIGERRLRRSALKDIAGMIRSFHYASISSVLEREREEDRAAGWKWGRIWYRYVAARFLRAYLERAKGAAFLPADPREIQRLLDVFLLEKALYELKYEIGNRPDWAAIPVQGILELVEHE